MTKSLTSLASSNGWWNSGLHASGSQNTRLCPNSSKYFGIHASSVVKTKSACRAWSENDLNQLGSSIIHQARGLFQRRVSGSLLAQPGAVLFMLMLKSASS